MEFTAGLWIGVLLGLLVVAPSGIRADNSKSNSTSNSNSTSLLKKIFTEGAQFNPGTVAIQSTQNISTSSVSAPESTSVVSSKASVAVTTVKDKNGTTVSPLDVSTTPLPEKKRKPEVLFDEDELPKNENGKPIVTKESLVGAGPSFDYVVPIVIAMLAVPFVVVLGAFLYKRSRDFWDRRHYRRMDFLIDGMYND